MGWVVVHPNYYPSIAPSMPALVSVPHHRIHHPNLQTGDVEQLPEGVGLLTHRMGEGRILAGPFAWLWGLGRPSNPWAVTRH